MSEHPVLCTCSSCGAVLDTERIDIRCWLPDAVRDIPEDQRPALVHGEGGPMLVAKGIGAFIRCLLPVRLTGGMSVVYGTWLRVDPDDLRHADEVWETPGYAALRLRGLLANAIKPWGADLQAGPVTCEVLHHDEIPYVTAASHPLITRVLDEEWDRDSVLSRMQHPLPVDVREPIGDGWSVVRTAGFTPRVVDDVVRFTAPDRTVIMGVHRTPPDLSAAGALAMITDGAPDPDGTLDEGDVTEVRHAFWITTTPQRRYELYGYAVRAGTFAAVTCMSNQHDQHDWAVEVWRSLRFTEPPAA